jgi:hypothetical protein
MDALINGGDVESAAYGKDQVTDTAQPEQESAPEATETRDHTGILDEWSKAEEKASTADTTSDEEEAEGAEEQAASEESEEKTSDSDTQEPDIDYIKAGGRKIKVDFSDRDKIKKAYQMAAGMRQFQKERDDARKAMDSLKGEVEELKGLWNKIETAASRNDYNELMKIMTAGKVDFDTVLKQRLEREKFREEATEDEIRQMDLEEQIKNLQAQLEKQSAEFEEKVGKAQTDREEAELKSLESKITPVFDRYRFHGKLGDPDAEHMMDEMLWTRTLTKLDDYEDLTPEIIRKEFKSVSDALNKVVKKQIDSAQKTASKERKREAKKTAQVQTRRGYIDNSAKQQAAQKIREGDLASVFRNWGKFGKLFD